MDDIEEYYEPIRNRGWLTTHPVGQIAASEFTSIEATILDRMPFFGRAHVSRLLRFVNLQQGVMWDPLRSQLAYIQWLSDRAQTIDDAAAIAEEAHALARRLSGSDDLLLREIGLHLLAMIDVLFSPTAVPPLTPNELVSIRNHHQRSFDSTYSSDQATRELSCFFLAHGRHMELDDEACGARIIDSLLDSADAGGLTDFGAFVLRHQLESYHLGEGLARSSVDSTRLLRGIGFVEGLGDVRLRIGLLIGLWDALMCTAPRDLGWASAIALGQRLAGCLREWHSWAQGEIVEGSFDDARRGAYSEAILLAVDTMVGLARSDEAAACVDEVASSEVGVELLRGPMGAELALIVEILGSPRDVFGAPLQPTLLQDLIAEGNGRAAIILVVLKLRSRADGEEWLSTSEVDELRVASRVAISTWNLLLGRALYGIMTHWLIDASLGTVEVGRTDDLELLNAATKTFGRQLRLHAAYMRDAPGVADGAL